MGKHSVVQAKNQLSELIDRALNGEDVVITRHGQPVVALKPVSRPVSPLTPEARAWLKSRRVGRRAPREDAARQVRRMRDAGVR